MLCRPSAAVRTRAVRLLCSLLAENFLSLDVEEMEAQGLHLDTERAGREGGHLVVEDGDGGGIMEEVGIQQALRR